MLADKNKFEKMIENGSKHQAVSSDARFEREAERQKEKQTKIRLQEFKRNEPENYKKAVILSKKYGTRVEDYIGADLSFVDNKGNILKGNTENLQNPNNLYPKQEIVLPNETENQKQEIEETPVQPEIAKSENNQESGKVEKINLSELHELQAQIKKEQGIVDEVDRTYKVSKPADETFENETSSFNQTDFAETNENSSEQSVNTETESSVSKTTENQDETVKADVQENQATEPSAAEVPLESQKVETSEEKQKTETEENKQENSNEKAEVHHSNYENPEIEKKLNSHVSKIDFSELEKAKKEIGNPNGAASEEKQPVKKAKTNIIFGMSNNSLKETVYEDLTEVNAGKKVTEEQKIATQSQEKGSNEFEGWSQEDIAIELERRRRLADLKQKYSDEQGKDPKDIGEYKKSLDFSINQDIKRFRMKPPKKPIIITCVLLLVAIIAAVVTTFAVLNKPPEPAHIVSAKISQTTTYQYVGETVDLRGLYIEELYSDGTKRIVVVDKTMISKKSENIDNNLLIASNNEYTYIEFIHNGKTQVLQISLTERIVFSIKSVEVYQEGLTNGSILKFDNILILADVKNSNNEHIGTKRIFAKDVSFEVDGVRLEKTADGVKLEGLQTGTVTLKISFTENQTTFEKTVEIVIE